MSGCNNVGLEFGSSNDAMNRMEFGCSKIIKGCPSYHTNQESVSHFTPCNTVVTS